MNSELNITPVMISSNVDAARVLLFIGGSETKTQEYLLGSVHCYQENTISAFYKLWESKILPDAVLLTDDTQDYTDLFKLLNEKKIPIVFYTAKFNASFKTTALNLKVDDYLYGSINEDFIKQVDLIKRVKSYKSSHPVLAVNNSRFDPKSRKTWALKRTFDILVSGTALLFLSPILILIALAIKIDSRGPIFYISKRSGTGYKVFDFYKFRTMRTGSDKELINLKNENQYGGEGNNAIFFKIKDDPRITRLGSFLRNTSLDELPQLLNVLKGDMSLVGNRPLPLYEAQQLTKDQISWRFLAPAGLTGLWQITKRGKDDMSPEERIQLDMEYAMNNSFLGDMKIILKTFPALLQKEKV
ncbi:MAG: sugar transferase [Ignavibacterium sp.]|jgi:lipopolysaccharide/colanic/teichoic acid biosynthesis glycosyltransferase|nr:sugar transferase [Ignavibacterium sp.]